MKSEPNQSKIVKNYYPNLQKIIAFSNYYRVLSPYSDSQKTNIRFFKVQALSNSFHISEESYIKTLKQYKQLFINLKIIKLERNFQNTLYLVESRQNFVYFSNYCQMKQKCKEQIQEVLMLRLLKFIVECKKYEQQKKISKKNLVLTDQYQFKLYDMKLYAINSNSNNQKEISPTKSKKKKNRLQINEINQGVIQSQLLQIFFEIDKTNKMQRQSGNKLKNHNKDTFLSIYQRESNYGQSQIKIEQVNTETHKQSIQSKFFNLKDNFKKHYSQKVSTLIQQVLENKFNQKNKTYEKFLVNIRNIQNQGRYSNLQFQDKQKNFIATICSQPDQKKKEKKNKKNILRNNQSKAFSKDEKVCLLQNNSDKDIQKQISCLNLKSRNKKVFFSIIFILCLLLAIGLAVFTYLRIQNSLSNCHQQSTYWNDKSHHCEKCYQNCQRCVGSEQNQCISCKGTMFLVINNLDHMIGSCMQSCQGKVISKNKCLMSLKT